MPLKYLHALAKSTVPMLAFLAELIMALKTGDWSGKDNKHYRGHLDRIFVSTTEEWEV